MRLEVQESGVLCLATVTSVSAFLFDKLVQFGVLNQLNAVGIIKVICIYICLHYTCSILRQYKT
jgi:hypothetical protein